MSAFTPLNTVRAQSVIIERSIDVARLNFTRKIGGGGEAYLGRSPRRKRWKRMQLVFPNRDFR